jgi:hypothetical protein
MYLYYNKTKLREEEVSQRLKVKSNRNSMGAKSSGR